MVCWLKASGAFLMAWQFAKRCWCCGEEFTNERLFLNHLDELMASFDRQRGVGLGRPTDPGMGPADLACEPRPLEVT